MGQRLSFVRQTGAQRHVALASRSTFSIRVAMRVFAQCLQAAPRVAGVRGQ